MNKFLLIAALLTVGLFFSSCGDDDSASVDNTAPVVTFNTPATGSTFSAGDTIAFSISIVEDVSLKTLNFSSNLGINEDFTTFDSETAHTQELNLVLDSMTVAGAYTVTASATDDSENTGESTIDLTIQ